MKRTFLGLGSNIGNRLENLQVAERMIEESVGRIISASSVYVTEAWGFESDSDFLNMVVCLETSISPSRLLKEIFAIESKLGRERIKTGYSSRIIDIDILFYSDDIVAEESLIIPHPQMHLRSFVLVPLNEIAPDLVHPVLNKNISDLLKACPDNGKVSLFRKS